MSYGAAFCGKSGEIQSKWKLLAGMSRDVGGTPTQAKAKKGEKFWRKRIERLESWRFANATGIDREIWNWRSANKTEIDRGLPELAYRQLRKRGKFFAKRTAGRPYTWRNAKYRANF